MSTILGNVQITWSTPRAKEQDKNNAMLKIMVLSVLFLITVVLFASILFRL